MCDFRCGKGFLALCGAGCPHFFSKPDRVAAHKVIGFCLLKDLVEHPSCLADVRIRAAIAPHPFQEVFNVDGAYAQSLTGVKSINISATLYEKGRIGTWQVVSRCSNSSQMQTCVASANYNMKPGKSYRLDFSATFQYSNGKSETITGSTSH